MKYFYLIGVAISLAMATTPSAKSEFDKMRKHLHDYNNEHTVLAYFRKYRFEIHQLLNGTQFLMVVSEMPHNPKCYVFDINQDIENIIRNSTMAVDELIRDLHHCIESNNARDIEYSARQFLAQYKNKYASLECDGHKILSHVYRPTFTLDELYSAGRKKNRERLGYPYPSSDEGQDRN